MTITLTPEELSKLIGDIADWYNSMTIYVLTNMAANVHAFGFDGHTKEEFHKWCKRYQEEHPKPDWKDVLP